MKIIFTLLFCLFFAGAMKSTAQWNLTGNANATATSILGTTNTVPLNFTTNNLQRLVIDANGKVGIGIAAPPNVFSVKGSGGVPNNVWVNSGNPLFTGFGEQTIGNADYILSMASTVASARPVFIGRRAKGTLAAPLSVSNNDHIMSFLSSAYDGTAFQNAAAIDFFVDGTPTPGNIPIRISFVTGSNSGNRAERLKIGNTGDITINGNQLFVQKSTGNVGVGTISPTAKLEITGQVKITGGNPASGKVLTSDSAGLASWQAPNITLETDPKVASVGLNKVPKYNSVALVDGTITDNGNVGIGEANPLGILHVSQPFNFAGVTFTGTGLNDLTVNNSGYTGTGTTSYAIRINNAGPNPNLIEISNDGGTTFSVPFAITNPIAFANGVTATFNDSTNHVFGDKWSWIVSPSFNNILIVKDGKLGIGTVSPNATLDVNGDALINGVTAGTGKGNNSSSTAFGKNALQNNEGIINTAIGSSALTTNTTGEQNTGVGFDALRNNTTGNFNTALGMQSLQSNLAGNENTGMGSFTLGNNKKGNANTAVGIFALNSNDSGANNVAMGRSALVQNVSGNANVAIGIRALRNNVSGSKLVAVGDSALFNQNGGNGFNTAVGSKALFANTTGENNTANGSTVLRSNTTGSNNTGTGNQALLSNTTGDFNTATGVAALSFNTTGNSNTAYGKNTLALNISGFSNVAVGVNALLSNTTGSNLVAIGDSVLFNQNGGQGANTGVGSKALFANTTGANNTACGFKALTSNSTGIANMAIGVNALLANTTGSFNTACGASALANNTSGTENIATGQSAMLTNSTGAKNTATGQAALMQNTSGKNNAAYGYVALFNNLTGNNNTAVGDSALRSNNLGNDNTAIGHKANSTIGNISNSTVVGANTSITASNQMRFGNSAVSSIGGPVGFTNLSDGRFKTNVQANVPGIEFINKLKPVTYHFDVDKINQFTDFTPATAEQLKAKDEKAAMLFTGFIAQEVEASAKELNYDFSGVDKPKNDKDMYGLRYAEFVVPLVKAVQELSKKNDELGMINDQLKKAKAEQDNRIARLEAMMQQLLNSKSTAPCPPLAGK